MKERIELIVHDPADLTTPLETLYARWDPKFLEENNGVGGGSFKLRRDDVAITEDPTLLQDGRVVRIKVKGRDVALWEIQKSRDVLVSEGEYAGRWKEFSGVGLMDWLSHAIVLPETGTVQMSDDRNFNFASKQGSWYIPAQWKNAVANGLVNQKTGPWGIGYPKGWPKKLQAYWIGDRAMTSASNPPPGDVYFRSTLTTTTAQDYRIVATADDFAAIMVNGERVLAITEFEAHTRTFTADISLPAGTHTFAVKVRNRARADGSGMGPTGVVMAVCKVNPDVTDYTSKFTNADRVMYTQGGTSWQVNAYPTRPPGFTLGGILKVLVQEAQARGVTRVQKITLGFSETVDSYGVAWPETIDPSFAVGSTLLDVVNEITDVYADVWMGPDMVLNMAPKRGIDRSVPLNGADPIAFRSGMNVLDSATDSTAEISNTVFAKTANGLIENPAPAASVSQFGRRETYLSVAEASTDGTAPYLIQQIIDKYAMPRKTPTLGIYPDDATQPYRDFQVGDWVLAPSDDDPDTLVKRRIVSISTEEDAGNGDVLFTCEIDTIQETLEQRLVRWLKQIDNAGASGGASGTSTGTGSSDIPKAGGPTGTRPVPIPQDDRIPDAPTALVVTANIVPDDRGVMTGSLAISWEQTGLATDTSDLPVRIFEIHYRQTGTGSYKRLTATSSKSVVYQPIPVLQADGTAMSYELYVVAVGENDIVSAASTVVAVTMSKDTEPPLQTSAPTAIAVRGVFTVFWDGKDVNGAPMVRDFSHVLIQHYNGSAWELVGRLGGASSVTVGGLSYGEHQFRMVPYDFTGNAGPVSATAIATSTALVGEAEFKEQFDQINSDIGANVQATTDAAAKAQQGVNDAATAQTAANQAAQDAADADLAAGNAAGAAQTAQNTANAAQQRANDLWAMGANLLQDAGFEGPAKLYSNSLATVDSSPTASIKVITDATKSHSGNSYLEIAAPVAPATSTTAHLRPIPVSPDRTYRIGVWVYAEALDANKSFGLPFYWISKDNTLINNTWPALYYWADFGSKLVVGQWKYIVADIKPPAGAVQMGTRFYIDNQNTTTKIRVDDLTVTDITEALAAQTAADAAQADANQAISDAADALGTAITGQAYSLNPSFEDWTGLYPTNFVKWGTGDPIKETTLVRLGNNAVRFTLDTTERGLNWNGILNHAPNLEYFAVELVFRLESGSLVGAGVLLDWIGLTGGNRAQINLGTEFPNPILGKWYKLVKTLRRPTTSTGTWTGMDGYLMGNYGGNGTPTAKDIIFDWLNVRPATNEEITAYGAPALITAVDSKATAAQSDATKALVDAKTAADAAEAARLAAVAAQSTADGKNTVSPNAPTVSDLSGKKANSLWTQVVGGKVIGAWYKPTDAAPGWSTMPFDPVMIPQIAIGAGTFGDLDGVRIKAKSIGAGQLTVGDFSNLLDDGNFEVVTPTPWTLYDDAVIQADSGRGNTTALRCMAAASRTAGISAQQFRRGLKGGDKFYVSMMLYRSLQVTTVNDIRVTVWYKKIDGTSNGSANVIQLPTTSASGWQKYVSNEITVPAGTEWLDIQLNVATTYTGSVVWDDVWLVKKVPTVSIENGAVKSYVLDTNEVFADSAVIGKLNAQTATWLTNADGTGNTSTVTGQGLRVQYTDPATGDVQDRIKVGTWDDDFIGLSNSAGVQTLSMNSDGEIAAQAASFDKAIMLAGDDLGQKIDWMPRSLVAWGQVPTSGAMAVTNGEIGLVELAFDTTQDADPRMYEFNINNFLVTSSGTGIGGLRLRFTTDGSTPTVNSPVIGYNYFMCAAGNSQSFGFTRIIGSNNGYYIRVLVCLYSSGPTLNVYQGSGGSQGYLYCTVKDLGKSLDPTAIANTGGGGSQAPAPVDVTKDFASNGVQSYLPSNAIYNYNTTKAYQGLSPAGYGNLRSMYTFPSVTSYLSGATIKEIWVYLYFEHWYNGSGGTARIGLHGNATKPTTFNGSATVYLTVAGWARGSGKWVKLPSSVYEGFRTGTWKGISLLGDSTYTTYGIANAAKLRLKYSK